MHARCTVFLASSRALSPTRTSSPPTTTSDDPTPSQGASSVAVLNRPTILPIGTPKVFDEMSTQQEASRGGVLLFTNMLWFSTFSSMVTPNKSAYPAFFTLEPVPLSTSLFTVFKFVMLLRTWVFSGTYGMQMLVSYGDHVVFDRGKHISSLFWPIHQMDMHSVMYLKDIEESKADRSIAVAGPTHREELCISRPNASHLKTPAP